MFRNLFFRFCLGDSGHFVDTPGVVRDLCQLREIDKQMRILPADFYTFFLSFVGKDFFLFDLP